MTATATTTTGALALVGGAEWTEGCTFDVDLLAATGQTEVVVLPTAAAYEEPGQVIERATAWFADLGATVRSVEVYDRAGAHAPEQVAAVSSARFIYIAGGSAMHLLSVLKRTPLWDAIGERLASGATVAAAGASATVVCHAMVDPRGGGFGVGLGLVDTVALIPRYEQWSQEKSRRTIEMAPRGLVLAGLPARTALIRDGQGHWRAAGAAPVRFFRDGKPTDINALG